MSKTQKKRSKHINKSKARQPMSTDIGMYLRQLRRQKGYSISEVAEDLGLSYSSIQSIERNSHPVPSPERLRIWLRAIGANDCYAEAITVLRQHKGSRTIEYEIRNPANEHIDRIIDAYENNTLTRTDLALIRLVAPDEYFPPSREVKKRQKKDSKNNKQPPKGKKKSSVPHSSLKDSKT